eukprot:g30045.t1
MAPQAIATLNGLSHCPHLATSWQGRLPVGHLCAAPLLLLSPLHRHLLPELPPTALQYSEEIQHSLGLLRLDRATGSGATLGDPQSRAAPELFDFVEQQHRALLEQLSQHFDREEGLVFGPKSEAVEDATLGPLVSPPLSRQDEEVIPTGVSGKIFELGMTAQPEADGDKEAPDPPELVSPRTAGSTGGVAARRSNLRNVLLSNSEYNKSWSSKLGPRLDTASVLLISLNAVLLIAEYQIEGEMIGVSLRKGEEPRVLARDVGNFFQFMEPWQFQFRNLLDIRFALHPNLSRC